MSPPGPLRVVREHGNCPCLTAPARQPPVRLWLVVGGTPAAILLFLWLLWTPAAGALSLFQSSGSLGSTPVRLFGAPLPVAGRVSVALGCGPPDDSINFYHLWGTISGGPLGVFSLGILHIPFGLTRLWVLPSQGGPLAGILIPQSFLFLDAPDLGGFPPWKLQVCFEGGTSLTLG